MSKPRRLIPCKSCGAEFAIALELCRTCYQRDWRVKQEAKPPKDEVETMPLEIFNYLYRFPPPPPEAFPGGKERFRGYRKPLYILEQERGRKQSAAIGGWQDA